ncbi:hypothetical protein ACTXG5_15525 [Mycobacterium sp. Dal123C01]|uniref:hypothetical protein n=1 Tax=Mycobacterium sp. Dal123C01 TaxID=3457577 RepID=UPI00403E7C68
MALTENDLEQVAVELIDIGEFVVTKGADGQPGVWQVDAKKLAFNPQDGQIVELRPAARTDQRAVSGIKAPLGTLVHRVRHRSYEALGRLAATVPVLDPDRVEETAESTRATFAWRRFWTATASDPRNEGTLDRHIARCTVRVGRVASSNHECTSPK